MAATRTRCPTCGSILELSPDMLNKDVECGECSEIFVARPVAKKADSRVLAEDYREDDRPAPGERRPQRSDDEYADDFDRSAGNQRSRFAYILLGLFLGNLGVHNFYARRMGSGVAQLLITFLSFPLMCLHGLGFLTILFTWVWVIVEIATVDRDGNGRRMIS